MATEFPTRREQMYGYVEAAVGTGLMLGPVIGQILYSLLNFELTFYCTAAILLIPIILCLSFLPSDSRSFERQHAESITSS